MIDQNNPKIQDNWWPEILQFISSEQPLEHELVLSAEIGHPVGPQSYRHLFSALIDIDRAEEVLKHPGGIGDRVIITSPFPDNSSSVEHSLYKPRTWIHAANIVPEGLEPLIVSWDSANWTFFAPDQGFLMTYSLIPRYVSLESGIEVSWDDLAIPRLDVVVSHPISDFNNSLFTRAFIQINRDYLQDYATIRNCHIIQVFYVENRGSPSPQISSLLQEHQFREFHLPGRLIQIQIINEYPPTYLAKVWGTRSLISPNSSPVTSRRQQYGSLFWPGIDRATNYETAMSFGLDEIYVSDSVLVNFEGRDGFSIHPDSGSIRYRDQWSSGYSRRIGRDIIAIELKKLYESAPAEVVILFNQHVVSPPIENIEVLLETPNVATRTRRIVYSLVAFGEQIAKQASLILNEKIEPIDIIGLSRQELDFRGWWEDQAVEPISRHIPIDLSLDNFFSRCELLDQLVIEGLSERTLRRTLITSGIDSEEIEEFRSLKLLSILLELVLITIDSGLRLIQDSQEIVSRSSLPPTNTYIPVLCSLHELRTLKSHRKGREYKQRLTVALKELKIDQASTHVGWGHALDKLYDDIASEIEVCITYFEQIV